MLTLRVILRPGCHVFPDVTKFTICNFQLANSFIVSLPRPSPVIFIIVFYRLPFCLAKIEKPFKLGAARTTPAARQVPRWSRIVPSTTSLWSGRSTFFRWRRCWTLETCTVFGYSLARWASRCPRWRKCVRRPTTMRRRRSSSTTRCTTRSRKPYWNAYKKKKNDGELRFFFIVKFGFVCCPTLMPQHGVGENKNSMQNICIKIIFFKNGIYFKTKLNNYSWYS